MYAYGTFEVGSESCPYSGQLEIVLIGNFDILLEDVATLMYMYIFCRKIRSIVHESSRCFVVFYINDFANKTICTYSKENTAYISTTCNLTFDLYACIYN